MPMLRRGLFPSKTRGCCSVRMVSIQRSIHWQTIRFNRRSIRAPLRARSTRYPRHHPILLLVHSWALSRQCPGLAMGRPFPRQRSRALLGRLSLQCLGSVLARPSRQFQPILMSPELLQCCRPLRSRALLGQPSRQYPAAALARAFPQYQPILRCRDKLAAGRRGAGSSRRGGVLGAVWSSRPALALAAGGPHCRPERL